MGTTVSTRSVRAKLTVTLEQVYVDASNWVVHQSWSREYTITSSSSLRTLPAESGEASSGGADPSGAPASSLTDPASGAAPVHTGSSTSVQTGASTFSITLTGGISSNVSFSNTDSLTTTTNENWNNGSDPTADFDQSGFNASSSQSKALTFSLTETLVSLPGGGTGRRFQLGFGGSKSSSMQMSGQYGQFEAAGTVMDKDGNPTTGAGSPMGSPDNGRGKNMPAIVPADPTDPAITPSDPPPVGGNGSRMESGGGFSLSGSVNTGFHLDGDVTMPDGAAIDEVAITGTTGFYTNMNSAASVSDSLSYDAQESSGSTLTGNDQYDYLSLGWSNSASGSSDFHFDMDMDLGDADLPPGAPASSGGSSGSGSGVSAPSLTAGGPPTPGSPIADFEFEKTSADAGGVWLRYETKSIEILPPSGLNPAATPITKTTKGGISIGLNAGASISTSTTLNDWKPELTIQANGHASVTFVMASSVLYQYGADSPPPEGYVLLISEKEKYFDSNDTIRAAVAFNLTATVGVTGIAMTGGVTINFTRNVLDHVGCYSHEKTQNLSDPTDVYEYWSKAGTIYRGSVVTAGGTGAASGGLTTTVSQSTHNYGESSSTGTPPIPPAPPPQVDVINQTLDYVQTGLDVAGMVPVIGEGCDLVNAGIALGRGNVGNAAMCVAAAIPFAGIGVAAGKFANKAANAVAKNANKLDEVAAAAGAITRNADEAGTAVSSGAFKLCFPAGTPVLTESGNKAIETVVAGERVWSYDIVASEWRLCDVLQTFERDYDGDSVFVTIEGETIESTFHHPYWVVAGESLDSRPLLEHHHRVPATATTPGRWVDAGDLQIGDLLLLRDGRRVPVTAIRFKLVQQKVYNFDVANLHNYAVGNLHVLVHNNNNGDELLSNAPKDSLKSTDALRRHNQEVQSLYKKHKLTKAQQRQVHDEISGMNYSRKEVDDIIQSKFGT